MAAGGRIGWRRAFASATVVLAITVANSASASPSLASLIGDSPMAYRMATIGLVGLAYLLLILVFQATKTPTARRRTGAGLVAFLGMLLLSFGAGRQIIDYRPFDPATTSVRLICQPDGEAHPGEALSPTIDYDASRRCVNGRTYYDFQDGALRRLVILRTETENRPIYEVRALVLTPDPYRAAPVMRLVKTSAQISRGDFALMSKMVSSKALCPAAEKTAIAEAATRNRRLQTAYGLMSTAAPRTERWICASR